MAVSFSTAKLAGRYEDWVSQSSGEGLSLAADFDTDWHLRLRPDRYVDSQVIHSQHPVF